jgi:nucleotide-binding universal stress UspA family protein
MKRMLIAVDGSPHAKKAIETAARLARSTSAPEVVLVNVRPWPVLFGEIAAENLQAIETAERVYQERLLDDAQAQAQAAGLTVRAKVGAVGQPAPEIVRVATENAVDQIVLGTRGLGALGSFFLGSVAQRVAHLASVPVLLVK